jgi:hypothetical protein
MPESSDDKKLNPQVRSVEIGKRTLRNLSIYPLSLSDQLSLTDIINKGLNAFLQMSPDESDEGMMQFISFILELIKKNIERIIEMITDEDKKVLEDVTNVQLMEIVEIVYEENFEGPLGKLKSLFPEVKRPEQSSPSPKPSRRVVRSTVTN